MSDDTDSDIQEQPSNRPSYFNNDASWIDVDDWVTRATMAQNQEYSKNAGRIENIVETIDQIETYILTTAFGNNGLKQCRLTVSLKFWYTHAYRSIAAKVRKKIQKEARSTTIKLNTIFVMVLLKDKVKNEKTDKIQNVETTEPVFYFKDPNGKVKYIDLFARVYNDWNDYLTSNWINPALICYPKDGHYAQYQKTEKPTFNSSVLPELGISESPACGILRTTKSWIKKKLSVVIPILTVASIVGIIPGLKNTKYMANLSPFIQNTKKYFRYVNLASTITFSLISIGDKVNHGDWDLVAEITTLAASILHSLGNDLAKRYLKGKIASGQQNLTAAQTFFFNLFAWSRCATSIASVLTTLIAMLFKPECSAMDYFLLASSLYSCYGLLTSPKSAQAIFNQVKAEYIKELLIAEQNKAVKNDNTNSDVGTNENRNTDTSTNGSNKGQEASANGKSNNEELIGEHNRMVKTMNEDKNDKTGKASYEYYEKNFVLSFKSTENEYVINSQLVRMMTYSPDIRQMICEIALTETILSIREGILLVNGQLNIDGAALAQVYSTEGSNFAERLPQKREAAEPAVDRPVNTSYSKTQLQKTNDYNTRYDSLTTDEDFFENLSDMKQPTGRHRFFFEDVARNFEIQFISSMGTSLDDYEINGEKLLKDMSLADKQRLHHQLLKYAFWLENPITGKKEMKYNRELFDAGVKLANARKCNSIRDLVSCIGIVEHESQANGVEKKQFLDDIINGKNNRLENLEKDIDALILNVEHILEKTKNTLGFHNSLEAYEHAMQHGQNARTLNNDDRQQRIESYLNKPGLPLTHESWN